MKETKIILELEKFECGFVLDAFEDRLYSLKKRLKKAESPEQQLELSVLIDMNNDIVNKLRKLKMKIEEIKIKKMPKKTKIPLTYVKGKCRFDECIFDKKHQCVIYSEEDGEFLMCCGFKMVIS